MTDYLDLALRYGGFTKLDTAYLTRKLAPLSDQQKRDFITPPPSVLNAYFAEIYQKQSPQAAMDYYLDLSCQLGLLQENPSFLEEKPFVRLNLSGQSFGFAYRTKEGLAQVFPEKATPITSSLLFEVAQIFPQYGISEQEGTIYMQPLHLEEEIWQPVETDSLLTQVARTSNWTKIWGVNQEEVLEVAVAYAGKVYYAWAGRQAVLYIRK